MTTTEILQVANEIRNQLGHKALYMLGAKEFAGTENSLRFKIMRNSKKITHIQITLNSMDLYNVEFFKIKRDWTKDIISELENVYVDQLHKLIEENTELYTSL